MANIIYILILGDVGGHLGLFVGAGVLTAFELLECIFMSTFYHCKRYRKDREDKMKEDLEDTPVHFTDTLTSENGKVAINGGHLNGGHTNGYANGGHVNEAIS